MPDYSDLTDLQLMILSALWDRREATIGELYEALEPRNGVARKTIATLLSRLEKRGLVKHRFEGREGVYRAAVTRRKVTLSRMTGVLGALFDPKGASAAAAVSRDDVRSGDVERLRALLRKAERDLEDLE